MSCGAALSSTCPSCGTQNPPGAKFCIECGTGLGAGGSGVVAPPPGSTPQPPPTPGVAAQGSGLGSARARCSAASSRASPRRPGARPRGGLPEERRKATVLFADLSGYTAVAERMDPEAVKSIIDRALRRLGQEVVRYGGSVDKYIGDNVMAVFGAPVAHEDDPERAVRAGLAMQAAMEEINQDIARRRRRQLLAAGRDQLRRGARRPGRRRLHGDRRRGQRRRAAAGGGATRKRHRRRDHPPPDPRRDRVRRARAARA